MSSFSKASNAAAGAATGAMVGGLPGAIAGGTLGLFGSGSPRPTTIQTNVPSFLLTNFTTPQGTVTTNQNQVTFNPNVTPTQAALGTVVDNQMLNAALNIPNQFDVNSAFNNPFYTSTLNMLEQPILTQKQQDLTALNNQLNAQNQIGSSYDAYQKNLLNQRYDNQLTNAQDQARQSSFNAYNQSLNNALATLSALRNVQNSALDAQYLPAKMALGFQGNVSQALANQANLSSLDQYRQGQLNNAYLSNFLNMMPPY